MKPFKSLKQAIRWADTMTPAGRWVDVVVIAEGRYYRLETRVVGYRPSRLSTVATWIYGPLQKYGLIGAA